MPILSQIEDFPMNGVVSVNASLSSRALCSRMWKNAWLCCAQAESEAQAKQPTIGQLMSDAIADRAMLALGSFKGIPIMVTNNFAFLNKATGLAANGDHRLSPVAVKFSFTATSSMLSTQECGFRHLLKEKYALAPIAWPSIKTRWNVQRDLLYP
jgi:hypothetical protein